MDRYGALIAATIMQDVAASGMRLTAQQGRLRLQGPPPRPGLIECITTHRAELLSYLDPSGSVDIDTTRNSPGIEGLCLPNATENLLTKYGQEEGRVVHYDPAKHDGRPVWDDEPGRSLESRHAGNAAVAGPDDPPWPGWLADFVLLLAPDDLPEGLRLGPATTVVDRAKYLAALRADIRRGARGPRAAVLGGELERLRATLLHWIGEAVESPIRFT